MSDTTNGQLYIYRTTPQEARVFLDFIDNEYLTLDWGSTRTAPKDKVLIGTIYSSNGASTDMTESATELAALAPHSVFEVWTDPKYEWLGDVVRYTPELGIFRGSCDAEGQVVLDNRELTALLDQQPADSTIAEFRTALALAMGQPWLDAIRALKDEPTEVTPTEEEE